MTETIPTVETSKHSSLEKQLECDLHIISNQITGLSNPKKFELATPDYTKHLIELLTKRNTLIETYVEAKGWKVESQLLITRHPKSKWGKLLGLSPDAPPSANGVASLTPHKGEESLHASNFMHLLLRNPFESIAFARSNMIRAGMLCNMIMKCEKIKIDSCVNSSDFQETYGVLKAASTTPVPEDTKDLITWRLRNEKLSNARKELSDAINAESAFIVNAKQGKYIDKDVKGISKKSLESRLNVISNIWTPQKNKPSSTWLVGHGKTSSKYFEKEFGVSSTFDFSTTKSIYLVRDTNTGELFKFSPPGGIKINNDGKLEGVIRAEEHILIKKQDPGLTAAHEVTEKPHEWRKTKNTGLWMLALCTAPLSLPMGALLWGLSNKQVKDTQALTRTVRGRLLQSSLFAPVVKPSSLSKECDAAESTKKADSISRKV